jgi:hypothetical protein
MEFEELDVAKHSENLPNHGLVRFAELMAERCLVELTN